LIVLLIDGKAQLQRNKFGRPDNTEGTQVRIFHHFWGVQILQNWPKNQGGENLKILAMGTICISPWATQNPCNVLSQLKSIML